MQECQAKSVTLRVNLEECFTSFATVSHKSDCFYSPVFNTLTYQEFLTKSVPQGYPSKCVLQGCLGSVSYESEQMCGDSGSCATSFFKQCRLGIAFSVTLIDFTLVNAFMLCKTTVCLPCLAFFVLDLTNNPTPPAWTRF